MHASGKRTGGREGRGNSEAPAGRSAAGTCALAAPWRQFLGLPQQPWTCRRPSTSWSRCCGAWQRSPWRRLWQLAWEPCLWPSSSCTPWPRARRSGRGPSTRAACGAAQGKWRLGALNNGPPQAAPQAVLTCRPLRALQAAQGAGELPPGEPRACQDPPCSREQTVKWWRGVLLSPGSPLAASGFLGLKLGRAPSAQQQAAGHPRPPRSPPPACFSPTAPCSIDPSCCLRFPRLTAAEDASDRQEGGGGEGGHHRDPQGSHPAAQVRHMVHGMWGGAHGAVLAMQASPTIEVLLQTHNRSTS